MFPHVPEWLWLLGFVSFNVAVNLVGIEFTARVNRYMLAIELVVLALFVVLGLLALYGGHGAGGLTLKPVYDPSVFSLATVAGATSIAVLSFLGFDGISTLSEENRGSQSAVGRATVLSLLLVGALFLLQTWIATDLARGMQFSSPGTAFYDIVRARRRRLAASALPCSPWYLHPESPMRWRPRRQHRASCSPWRATTNCPQYWLEFIRAFRHRTSARWWSPWYRCWSDCFSPIGSTI